LLALLASTFFPACYNIYAVFTATGIVTGPNQFQSVSGTLSVYIDPNQDTTWSITSFINPATPRAARR
jgi:hypothetical protein